MNYWDSSAVVALLLSEASTPIVREIVDQDPGVVTFWSTEVECVSAVARLERDGSLSGAKASRALDRLARMQSGWSEIQPFDIVRERARRLLRTHPLRTADALQLAAALIAAEERPATLAFVSLDHRLRNAAEREGFPLLPVEL